MIVEKVPYGKLCQLIRDGELRVDCDIGEGA